GQAGDVRLPGLHAHLREGRERAVLAEADHDLETDAGQAESDQRPAQAAHAPAHTGAGPLAGQRGARAHGLLCRARQLRGGGGLLRPGDPVLAESAEAPQPENQGRLDADGPDPETMATTGARDASLPGGALRRHTPKVGAQCGNPARWDLRGGPPVRAVPTATLISSCGQACCGCSARWCSRLVIQSVRTPCCRKSAPRCRSDRLTGRRTTAAIRSQADADGVYDPNWYNDRLLLPGCSSSWTSSARRRSTAPSTAARAPEGDEAQAVAGAIRELIERTELNELVLGPIDWDDLRTARTKLTTAIDDDEA